MASFANLFVSYLNRYTTTSSDHEAVFDEFISQAPEPKAGPLRIDTTIENFVRNRFAQPTPPSIILTGNAGDGKTYLCRQIIHAFAGKDITSWGDDTEFRIDRDAIQLHVVKDLSEMSDTAGMDQLHQLNAAMIATNSTERYLIAANEGRLRALLTAAHLDDLYEAVNTQLLQGPDQNNQRLIVVNLNRVTTSSYVTQALRWMTDPVHWEDCEGCPILDRCPIRFNATRLREEQVQQRVTLLYRLLEHLDVHVTIRDMLMHLAYTLTGGQSCDDLIGTVMRSNWSYTRTPLVYYENVWALQADASFRRKAVVVQQLERFPVGQHSLFAVDNFIINGHEHDGQEAQEYVHLFAPAVDLGQRLFAQDRDDYLRGGAPAFQNDNEHELLKWLPRCRRKLFFEGNDSDQMIRLIPFLFLPDYQCLLNNEWSALERCKRDIVLGLNRAFAQLYITEDDNLFVTAQYLHTAEQPQPLVRLKFPIESLWLTAEAHQTIAYDDDRINLQLIIGPPPAMYGTHQSTEPVRWRLNLLLFEYLMRLAHGGTYDVLGDECGLAIRQLKDELIGRFVREDTQEAAIEFFVADQRRYTVRRLRFDSTTGRIQG
jgi:hypothetical protein